jgi:hypothetical protein
MVLLSSLLFASGCTHVTYSGPRRGADEVAILVTTGGMAESGHSTEVAKIDGTTVSGSKFELLPGRHSVEVKGTLRPPVNNGAAGALAGVAPAAGLGMMLGNALMNGDKKQTSDQLVACFVARPKHTYEVRSYGQGKFWVTEVIDQATTYDVKTPCEPAKDPR